MHSAAKWQVQFFRQQPTNQVLTRLLVKQESICLYICVWVCVNIHRKKTFVGSLFVVLKLGENKSGPYVRGEQVDHHLISSLSW